MMLMHFSMLTFPREFEFPIGEKETQIFRLLEESSYFCFPGVHRRTASTSSTAESFNKSVSSACLQFNPVQFYTRTI